MKNLTRLMAATILTAASLTAHPLVAEENLLWKSVNTLPAVVVPAYGGQPSPFPEVAKKELEVSSTLVLDEQRRKRDEAYATAEKILASGKALLPDLRLIRIGGRVQGTMGTRILVGNDWVGTGSKLPVRQYRAPAAIDAISNLASFDASAAADLSEKLNAQYTANPILMLTLQRITTNTLVFGSARGTYDVNINLNNNN